MTLRLYRISGSPFAWRAHLALEHKRALYESSAMVEYIEDGFRTDRASSRKT